MEVMMSEFSGCGCSSIIAAPRKYPSRLPFGRELMLEVGFIQWGGTAGTICTRQQREAGRATYLNRPSEGRMPKSLLSSAAENISPSTEYLSKPY